MIQLAMLNMTSYAKHFNLGLDMFYFVLDQNVDRSLLSGIVSIWTPKFLIFLINLLGKK